MKNLSMTLVPIVAAIALVFGGWYVYLGALAVRAGSTAGGAFAVVFGIAGIALGMALFRARRLLRSHSRARTDAAR